MEPEQRALALDISSRTGYALVQGNRFIKSGVRDFRIRTSQHRGHQGIMFYNFLLSLGRIDFIFYEEIMFAGSMKNEDGKIVHTTNDGREIYHGLKMVMNMFAAGFDINPQGIWPGTVKKAFAGHGKAEKHDMCRAARELGWKGGQSGSAMFHDEADAIAIMSVMMRQKFGIDPRF